MISPYRLYPNKAETERLIGIRRDRDAYEYRETENIERLIGIQRDRVYREADRNTETEKDREADKNTERQSKTEWLIEVRRDRERQRC